MEMSMPAMVQNSPQSNGKDHVTQIDNVGSSITSDKDNYNDTNDEEPPPKRVARHRRKGIPQHAPFF
jgi:hypothetical protein